MFHQREFTIYSIQDPYTLEIVYIGSTSDFKGRCIVHLGVKNESPISKYMQRLRNENVLPIFKELFTATYNQKFYMENWVINKFISKGTLLLNVADNTKENKLLAIEKYLMI